MTATGVVIEMIVFGVMFGLWQRNWCAGFCAAWVVAQIRIFMLIQLANSTVKMTIPLW